MLKYLNIFCALNFPSHLQDEEDEEETEYITICCEKELKYNSLAV